MFEFVWFNCDFTSILKSNFSYKDKIFSLQHSRFFSWTLHNNSFFLHLPITSIYTYCPYIHYMSINIIAYLYCKGLYVYSFVIYFPKINNIFNNSNFSGEYFTHNQINRRMQDLTGFEQLVRSCLCMNLCKRESKISEANWKISAVNTVYPVFRDSTDAFLLRRRSRILSGGVPSAGS